ncbi:M15 family metallopeptidase [Cellulosilyticum ruminicola]|uniref:M15 family metallopeptidase n=1 Tax=Cellulosilyticum ruminicola TaxID=425254 RepID=UPI0006D22B5E|nr:M15 family metallopeptidase [Cellulosilyticum ruminicola]
MNQATYKRKYNTEDTKEVIIKAFLGVLVGFLFIVVYSVCYTLGGKIKLPEMFSKVQMIDKPAWNLQLVNAENVIPDQYDIDLILLRNGQSVDRRIYDELQEMMDDARAEGLTPLICSSYRSHDKQISLFNQEVSAYMNQGYSREEAIENASKWVAIPGTSEHELGLAVDIVSVGNQILDQSQEQTPEQKWLMDNCYKYGFILRYPADKSEITGISYEPWHYRYVGKSAAKMIKEQNICLEEYLEGLK